MYLYILFIECIIYIDIYNMPIYLLFIVNVFKLQVIISMECVQFFDVLHRIQEEIPLQFLQWNLF